MTFTYETLFQDSDTTLVLFFNFFNIHWFADAVLDLLVNELTLYKCCTSVELPLSRTLDDFHVTSVRFLLGITGIV